MALTAIWHQKKLETISAGDPQRQATLYGLYGLPMENIVPRAAINLLKSVIAFFYLTGIY
jgi:hypothetical protein